MATGLTEVMKMAAMDVMDNAKMCDLRWGTVISTSPLKIQITNQFILPESVLVVPHSLTKYDIALDLTLADGTTISSITIDNSLKVNDRVALIRKYGGQSYYVLDKI